MTVKKGLLSIMFNPFGPRAEVLLHTIPDRRAYTGGFELEEGYASDFRDQKALASRLLDIVQGQGVILKRNEYDDLTDTPSAPIMMMFSRCGFDHAKFGEYFYAGMGHSGYFLGEVSYALDGRMLTIGASLEAR